MKLDRYFWPVAACFIAAAGTLEFSSARLETQTWDEGIHLSAGYAYLTRGDYRWNQEHPPLIKLLCALPLTRMGVSIPDRLEGWKQRDAVRFGVEFLYRQNKVGADAMLLAARSANMLLSIAFFAAFAWWVRRRFGAAAGLLALALCCFDPNLIAHARYITTDAGVTAFYFLTCALWIEYLESGRGRDLWLAAAAFSLALVTKYSAVLLIPTLLALYAFRWAQRPAEFPLRRAAAAAGALAAALFLAVNIVYWPETLRCLTTKYQPLHRVVDRGNVIGRVLYRAGLWFHLPAHGFLTGLAQVAAHNADGHPTYLMGLRSEKGWWYYFPVVFAVKSTLAALLGTALLLAAGLRAALRRSAREGIVARFRSLPLVWAGLLFPPAFYFALSATSGINIGMRHILPVYPFLYAAIAALLAGLGARRVARVAMLALGTLQAAECARITPDYLAYFNPLAGGPGNGPQYLVDSNIDWGQDVKKLARWLNAHGTRVAYVGYFGNAQMYYYGVDGLSMPPALDSKAWEQVDGFVVASATPLEGVYVPLVDFAPLRLREPIAKVGWSMYVYDFRKKKPPAP